MESSQPQTSNDIRTGHVICYDMDFPSFIQQAGKRDVDILFAPSSDWREVRFLHAASARFRAVENGCSLVRPTMQGLSIATDPYGRMLAYQDYYSNTPRLSIVGVPSRGVRTIYGACGELFSIVCIVLFVLTVACQLAGSQQRAFRDSSRPGSCWNGWPLTRN